MLRRALVPAVCLTLAAATAAVARPAAGAALFKWPPWLSIESPVNPYDASARGAAFLVHATTRDGTPTLDDISGSAEGLVGGARRTMPIRFEATSRPGTFAVRRQWPAEGAWLVRISLHTTTALVTLDRNGDVAGVQVPTQLAGSDRVPRPVLAREIDSTLTLAARR